MSATSKPFVIDRSVQPGTPLYPAPIDIPCFQPQTDLQPADTSPTSPSALDPAQTTPGKIPRPRNAFILFRSNYIEKHRNKNKMNKQQDLSQIAGQLWNGMTQEDRDCWNAKAAQEKLEHQKRYPFYKNTRKHCGRSTPKKTKAATTPKMSATARKALEEITGAPVVEVMSKTQLKRQARSLRGAERSAHLKKDETPGPLFELGALLQAPAASGTLHFSPLSSSSSSSTLSTPEYFKLDLSAERDILPTLNAERQIVTQASGQGNDPITDLPHLHLDLPNVAMGPTIWNDMLSFLPTLNEGSSNADLKYFDTMEQKYPAPDFNFGNFDIGNWDFDMDHVFFNQTMPPNLDQPIPQPVSVWDASMWTPNSQFLTGSPVAHSTSLFTPPNHGQLFNMLSYRVDGLHLDEL